MVGQVVPFPSRVVTRWQPRFHHLLGRCLSRPKVGACGLVAQGPRDNRKMVETWGRRHIINYWIAAFPSLNLWIACPQDPEKRRKG